MDFDFGLWLGVTAILSVVAIVFIKQQEKLAAEVIASGDLIVIKANPQKAWPIWLLNTILLSPLVVFTLWQDTVKPTACSRLFELNIDYLCLVLLIWGMPIIFSLIFYNNWLTAKKALKNGYFPPSDSICMFKTEARSLKLKKVRTQVYFIIYISPLFALAFYAISILFYTKLGFDRDYAVIEKSLESKCLVIKHYP